MACSSCSRNTLGLFIRSITRNDILTSPRLFLPTFQSQFQSTRSISSATTSAPPPNLVPVAPEYLQPPAPVLGKNARKKLRKAALGITKSRPKILSKPTQQPPPPPTEPIRPPPEKEPWQIHKAALKAKLGDEPWNPRKKLSPDTQEGIRHLQKSHPDKFTTPVLAAHFKVSPEAIRRILKSKWQPSDEEAEERLKRWDKRGERIWSNLVELGVKPPKKWREMGVGKASGGERPKWKGPKRNLVGINDSVDGDEVFDAEELIPIVDGKTGERVGRRDVVRSEQRLLDRIL